MKERSLEEYKKILLDLRQECLEKMERLESDYLHSSPREAAGELSGYTQHMADMSADGYEIEKNINFINRESELLYEIEEALYRLEKGKFGYCEDCGNLIELKRLEAKPYARYCIECQSKQR